MSYEAYLHTPWWRARRYQALEEARYRCQDCGRRGLRSDYLTVSDGLAVHHLSYENLGREPAEDLMVLCAECHAHRHGRRERTRGLTPIAAEIEAELDRLEAFR